MQAPGETNGEFRHIQNEEIEAISAIYGDDFKLVKVNSAWGIESSRLYSLVLVAQSTSQNNVAKIELAILLDARYPAVSPKIDIKQFEHVFQTHVKELEATIQSKVKQLKGQELIYEITSLTQECLNSWQSEISQRLASLDQERAVRVSSKLEQERALRDQVKLREEEARAEEDQILQRLIEQKVKIQTTESAQDRSENSKLRHRNSDISELKPPTTIKFERTVTIPYDGSQISFDSIGNFIPLCLGRQSAIYLANPQLEHLAIATLALKLTRFTSPYWTTAAGRKQLQRLEGALEKVHKVRHANLTSLYEFQVVSNAFGGVDLQLLQPFKPRGSIARLLQDSGLTDQSQARLYSIDILEGLNELHRLGLVHSVLHLENVLLDKVGSRTIATLNDFGYCHLVSSMTTRNIEGNLGGKDLALESYPPGWRAPEHLGDASSSSTRKSDIWYYGVIVLQLLYGPTALEDASDPWSLIKTQSQLPAPALDFVQQIFHKDPSKRPSTSDLLTSHYVRLGVDPFNTSQRPQLVNKRNSSSHSPLQPRVESAVNNEQTSRYRNDFEEIEVLGKGGFGEVIKAKNRIDGRLYAVKKIPLRENQRENGRILREVVTLSRLNHEHIVRYFATWVEGTVESPLRAMKLESRRGRNDQFFPSSSNISAYNVNSLKGPPTGSVGIDIHFGDTDIEEDESSSEDGSETPSADQVAGSNELSYRPGNGADNSHDEIIGLLYIQMEYCEGKTVFDAISAGIEESERWRLIRQCIEALLHLHQQGMIHRDLKPSNIFLDQRLNAKIGDFGLATESHTNIEAHRQSLEDGQDLTSGVGTALYVAPEVLKSKSTVYNGKVDMYSLGIIIFEMWHKSKTSMERIKTLNAIRADVNAVLSFSAFPKGAQHTAIVQWLLQPLPENRPTSQELLESSLLPTRIENEYIEQGLKLLSNPNTPPFRRLLTSLFSHYPDKYSEYTYDDMPRTINPEERITFLKFRDRITNVFKTHGSVEREQPSLHPRTALYNRSQNVARFLDHTGMILQLPYDMTVPFARSIARFKHGTRKSHTASRAYRENSYGGAPIAVNELSFDIVQTENVDTVLDDVETIQVLDEVLQLLTPESGCVLLNHTDILIEIMDFCQVDYSRRPQFCSIMSGLGFASNWTQIRNQLRAQSLVPSSSLDTLQFFDFSDDLVEFEARLQTIPGFPLESKKLRDALEYVRNIREYLKAFDLSNQVKLAPLSVFNFEYYASERSGGIMLQATSGSVRKTLLCAGGRYGALIEQFERPAAKNDSQLSSVGFTLALDKFLNAASKLYNPLHKTTLRRSDHDKQNGIDISRCDVLVGSIGKFVPSEIFEVCQELWDVQVRCDYYNRPVVNIEGLANLARGEGIHFAVLLRPRQSSSTEKHFKVRRIADGVDHELLRHELAVFLHSEIPDPGRTEANTDSMRIKRAQSRHSAVSFEALSLNVKILNQGTKRKEKGRQKQNAISRVHGAVTEVIEGAQRDPTFAVDLTQDEFDALRATTLFNDDAWRKLVDSGTATKRSYLIELRQELLNAFEKRSRYAWISSFRSGQIMLYELRGTDKPRS